MPSRLSALRLTVEIASVPDREGVVAELWAGGHQSAEIRHDGGAFVVQVFAPPHDSVWELSVEQIIDGLKRARERLEAAEVK